MKLKEARQFNFRIEGDMIMAGTMTAFKYDMYRSMLYLWEGYVKQIIAIMKYPEREYHFGMNEDAGSDKKNTVLGMLYDHEGMKIFFMNPLSINLVSGIEEIDVKMLLLGAACHEVAHIKYPNHYEDFANEHTKIATKIMNNVFNGSFAL